MHKKTAFISLLLFPLSLCAAPADDMLSMMGTEDMYIDEMPVIISATRLSQPLNESPISTTVIDRQMIDAAGARTIPDILRLVPGFNVGYLNGNSPVATYHGQSGSLSNRIQLVIDGRSVYLPTLAGVSWSNLVISIEDIERLEVVRGPNASTYGNNAFLAVVSITTKHASQGQGTYIKGTTGSQDTADGFARYAGRSGDLDYRISVGTKNDSGTKLLDDFTETDFLSYRLDYQIDLSTQLYYSGGLQDNEFGDVQRNQDNLHDDVNVTTAFQHIKLEHTFENDSSLAIQYYYNYTKSLNSEFITTVSLSDFGSILSNIDDFDITERLALESERHDLELAYYYNPLDTLRLVSGASVRADKVIANNVFDADTDNTLLLYRFFTHGEYQLTDRFLINAGFMVEDNSISGTDIAPRLAFIYHLTNQHSFRLSASQATRTPTIFDENGYVALQQQLTQDGGQPLNNPPLENILGGDTINDTLVFNSGNVDSEEITSYEFGWMAQLLNNTLTLDLKLFSDETQKLIDEIDFIGDVPGENADDLYAALGLVFPGSGADDTANVAGTRVQGFEFYADYNITTDWRLYGYFAYTEIQAKYTRSSVDIGKQAGTIARLEDSIPRRSFGAILMKQWESHISTSLSIYRVSDMGWLDRARNSDPAFDFSDKSAEAYTKVDFVIRKTHRTASGQIDLSLIIQNIGNAYFDYTQTNFTDATRQTVDNPGSLQDRRAYFELAFRFN